MVQTNICFWLTVLCAGGAWYSGPARPLYRTWVIVLLVLLLIAPETRDFVEHWLMR